MKKILASLLLATALSVPAHAANSKLSQFTTSAVNTSTDQLIAVRSATSSTSNTIGTGTQTFSTQSGLGFVTGQPVSVYNTGNTANFMQGTVISYIGSTLVINVPVTTPASFGGSGTFSTWTINADFQVAPSFLQPSNNLSDLASASAARANLGLGTAATQAMSAFLQPSNNLSDLANAATARANLGLVASATTDTTNAANITTGTLPAARLPNPSATTLGGMESIAPVSHQFLTGLSTSGVPSQAQPSFSDISGNISVGQMNSGTAASISTFWRGDGTWATPAGGGNVSTSGTPATGNLTKFSSGTTITNGDLSGDCSTSGTMATTCTKTNGSSFAPSATTDTTNASNISSGTLASARGGVGTVNGIVKANGSGVTSAAVAGDFPTLNQNTTGSAASFTGSLAGDVTGTQGATTVGGINGTSLAALSTGIVKNTTGTGVPTIAAAGTDYVAPGGALGTPSSGTLTNLTGLPLTSGVTGILPIANGGAVVDAIVTSPQFNASGFIAQTVTTPASVSGTLTQGGGTSITVAGATGGTLGIGSVVTPASGTPEIITALGTGTGGNGTYTVNTSQTISGGTAFSASGVVAAGSTVIPVANTSGFAVGQVVIIAQGGTSGTKDYAGTITAVSANTSITIGTSGSVSFPSGTLFNKITTSGTTGLTSSVAPGNTVYSVGTVATTASASSGATSVTVASTASYAVGQGLEIYGGATSGANLITTITGINAGTSTISFSPAISNASGIASGTLVKHDDTAAFQAAMNLGTVTKNVNIFVPDGYYQVNGAPTATNCYCTISLPDIKYYGNGFAWWNAQATIHMYGSTAAPQEQSYLATKKVPHESGAIIQSDLGSTTSGSPVNNSIFGAYSVNAPTSGVNMTNVQFIVENMTFRTYPNPQVTVMNMTNTESLKLYGLDFDEGGTGVTTQPTSSGNNNNAAVIFPGGDNGGNHVGSNLQFIGYFNGIVVSEHTRLEHVRLDNVYNPILVAQSQSVYGITGVDVEFNACPFGIAPAGTASAPLDFSLLNLEHQISPAWVTNQNDISDSSGVLTGFISIDQNASGTPTQAINVFQATKLHVVNAKAVSYPIPSQVLADLSSAAYPMNNHYSLAPNGTPVWCSDCQPTSPCTGSGNGALAIKVSGSYTCNPSGTVNVNISQSSLSGTTAGTIGYSMPMVGSADKKFIAVASGYENNTAVNQTITFPTAFTNTPVIVGNSTGLTLSVSTTALTITAPNNTTLFSGTIVVEGN